MFSYNPDSKRQHKFLSGLNLHPDRQMKLFQSQFKSLKNRIIKF